VITVLVIASVTALIAGSFLTRAALESRLATRAVFLSAALNLAEAGIEEGLYAANTGGFNSDNGWTAPSGTTDVYVKTISSGFDYRQGTGALHIRVDGATGRGPVITATGVISIPNQPRLLKQLRVGVGPRKIWANGIVAKGNVTFTGSAHIDGYDSGLGPWNAATNRNDRATVATNATVVLSGSTYVYGSVATGGAAPSVGGSGRIYGATSPGTPLVDSSRVRTDFSANFTDATAPTTAAISLGAYSVGGSSTVTFPRAGDTPGANGRYLYTASSLSVAGSGHIVINGPVDIIVTGNVTVGGSGYIAVGGGTYANPTFNLYAGGTVGIGGNGMVNGTALPASASIWGTAPTGSSQSITIGGSGEFVGTIYAPNADVVLSGSGDVSGAVIGKTVVVSGAGVMHYDVQLAQLSPLGGPTPDSSAAATLAISSWAELTAPPGSGGAFARDNRVPFNTLF
jgi:hypothetical protein